MSAARQPQKRVAPAATTIATANSNAGRRALAFGAKGAHTTHSLKGAHHASPNQHNQHSQHFANCATQRAASNNYVNISFATATTAAAGAPLARHRGPASAYPSAAAATGRPLRPLPAPTAPATQSTSQTTHGKLAERHQRGVGKAPAAQGLCGSCNKQLPKVTCSGAANDSGTCNSNKHQRITSTCTEGSTTSSSGFCSSISSRSDDESVVITKIISAPRRIIPAASSTNCKQRQKSRPNSLEHSASPRAHSAARNSTTASNNNSHSNLRSHSIPRGQAQHPQCPRVAEPAANPLPAASAAEHQSMDPADAGNSNAANIARVSPIRRELYDKTFNNALNDCSRVSASNSSSPRSTANSNSNSSGASDRHARVSLPLSACTANIALRAVDIAGEPGDDNPAQTYARNDITGHNSLRKAASATPYQLQCGGSSNANVQLRCELAAGGAVQCRTSSIDDLKCDMQAGSLHRRRSCRNKSLPYNLVDSTAANHPTLRELVSSLPRTGAGLLQKRRLSQSMDLRASLSSLTSVYASFSPVDNPRAGQIEKLRQELSISCEKATCLAAQLRTSTEIISRFESSLSNMTVQLHQLSFVVEHKERDINHLKMIIEKLRAEQCCLNHELNQLTELKLTAASKQGCEIERVSTLPRSSASAATANNSHWLLSPIKKAKNKLLARPELLSPKRKLSLAASFIDFETATSPTKTIDNELLKKLKAEIVDKDRHLCDMRLKSLSTSSQIEAVKDEINQIYADIERTRAENALLRAKHSEQD